ncbi:hypothetical protein LO762_25705 [Actinocorallia sp. API 0066]|uniref:hypothetical protein n=1 Tax=Actinocorallia sp. API 0066 TaxID=2896846 RepID=UPI001E3F103C|nr:hypothetical protein [Actinocorallia sp. API 0066]MCD0452553.1 hypothetical protein [Actinocorallia sp. API 0066]
MEEKASVADRHALRWPGLTISEPRFLRAGEDIVGSEEGAFTHVDRAERHLHGYAPDNQSTVILIASSSRSRESKP